MLKTIEATIDEKGNVELRESIQLSGARRALVTILDDEPSDEPAALSQEALADDWDRDEEDRAWSHLQAPGR